MASEPFRHCSQHRNVCQELLHPPAWGFVDWFKPRSSGWRNWPSRRISHLGYTARGSQLQDQFNHTTKQQVTGLLSSSWPLDPWYKAQLLWKNQASCRILLSYTSPWAKHCPHEYWITFAVSSLLLQDVEELRLITALLKRFQNGIHNSLMLLNVSGRKSVPNGHNWKVAYRTNSGSVLGSAHPMGPQRQERWHEAKFAF